MVSVLLWHKEYVYKYYDRGVYISFPRANVAHSYQYFYFSLHLFCIGSNPSFRYEYWNQSLPLILFYRNNYLCVGILSCNFLFPCHHSLLFWIGFKQQVQLEALCIRSIHFFLNLLSTIHWNLITDYFHLFFQLVPN